MSRNSGERDQSGGGAVGDDGGGVEKRIDSEHPTVISCPLRSQGEGELMDRLVVGAGVMSQAEWKERRCKG